MSVLGRTGEGGGPRSGPALGSYRTRPEPVNARGTPDRLGPVTRPRLRPARAASTVSEAVADRELAAPEVGLDRRRYVLPPGRRGELDDRHRALRVGARIAHVRHERHVAVRRRRRHPLLPPLLVEQVAEVEDVELHGDALPAHLREVLPQG